MTRIERFAALLLACVLVGLVLNGELRPPRACMNASGRELPMSFSERAAELGCGRFETCANREDLLLQQRRACLRNSDGPCLASTERTLAETRRALTRFSPADHVHIDSEADSCESRIDQMDALADEYAALSPDARAAIGLPR